ncbi:hypothetical protein BGZ68_007048 [Mortierella alpina]|nr:hypothetical protein BGZ68_007048 [Mortierella alpina]
MGLKDFFKTLAKKGLKPTYADLSEIEENATVDVDLLGTPLFRNFLLRHITEGYDDSSALATGTALGNYVFSLFGGPDRVVRIHLDGAPSEEKQCTHEARLTKRTEHMEDLAGELVKMREKSEQGKWTCQTTISKITKLLHQVFVLETTDKARLVEGMQSRAGITVCECRSESDTCIARVSTAGPHVVVSGDSDLLAYRTIDRVLRSIPRTSDFGWYKKEDILRTLELPTDLHLVLLAIVLKNDYGSNIKGLGIVRNCNIIRQIPQPTDGNLDSMLQAYVAAAQAQVKKPVSKSQFNNAKRIFFDHTETIREQSGTSNEFFTRHSREFQHLKDLRFQMAREARAARPGPVPFYVAKRSKRNQFRPIFRTKESILSGSKEVDISKVQRHEAPARAPRKGPARKKQKRKQRAIKKKQKIYQKKAKKDGEEKEHYNLQASTRRDHSLRKKYICKTLKIGSVHGNLARTGSLDEDEAKIVANTIQSAAVLLNKIQVHAYELIAWEIASIIGPSSTPQLTASQRSDLEDIVDSDAFYFSLATLLCQGGLGVNSQYQRQLSAPPRTMGTRRTAAGVARGPVEVPHAQRAFESYQNASGFVPFFTREVKQGLGGVKVQSSTGSATFSSTAARLALSSVKAAVRMHYLGSKFGEEERPDDVNPIEYFFEKNRQDPQFSDFPRSKFAPGHIYLLEADLVSILYSTPATQPIITRIMGGLSKTAAQKSVVATKGLLIKLLFYDTDSAKRLDGYHKKVSLQKDTAKNTKYKLRGTISTNGHILNLIAYDTTAPKKKRILFADDEIDFEEDDGEADDDHTDDSEEEEIEVASTTVMECQVDSSAGPSTGDKRPHPSVSADAINWKRGSKILTNIETAFVKPEDCPDASETIIVGIDPGEIKTASATRIGPVNDTTRVSIDINRSFLYRPYTKFRHLLQERKVATGIDILESRMPSMTLQGIGGYLQYLREEGRREQLFAFYLSPWYMRKAWDMRKAQQASYDYAIKAIMRLGGVSDCTKRDETRPNVVFAVCLGSFNSQTGLPNKHGALIRKLVIRARSLGYGVYGVHEYFTSAKCPRRSCNSFLQSITKSRSRYCKSCKAYFDRDHVGSENIGIICQAQILHQRHPDKYKPMD